MSLYLQSIKMADSLAVRNTFQRVSGYAICGFISSKILQEFKEISHLSFMKLVRRKTSTKASVHNLWHLDKRRFSD